MKVMHNYTEGFKFWGHDMSTQPVNNGLQVEFIGHSDKHIDVGDYMLFSNPGSQSGYTAYRVDAVRNYGNPGDMYSGEASWIPTMQSESVFIKSRLGTSSWWQMNDLELDQINMTEIYNKVGV